MFVSLVKFPLSAPFRRNEIDSWSKQIGHQPRYVHTSTLHLLSGDMLTFDPLAMEGNLE